MSYEDTSLRCRNCKFWWPQPNAGHDKHVRQHAAKGECRRRAPTVSPAAGDRLWATTLKDDWCGEHLHAGA